ncbi:cysteine-rich RECEPTOR-like kinase [Rhynchospora pubera]|uniref:non-specific serine/threonine protein kinase n=1 Tax=Rhynchospora pubera TaxID=906938 RepID=A0AAV8EXP9_9POAL|nr:cysteine-rich RECEPTOR-like kinase [Rhynchospora pubera]
MSIFLIVLRISLLPFLLVLLNSHMTSCTMPLNRLICSKHRYPPESPSWFDLDQLLSTLPASASRTGFYNSSKGGIFGVAICLADASPSYCLNCLNLAVQNLTTKCNHSASTVSWFDRCMLHYTHAYVFSLPTTYGICRTWGDREDYLPNLDSFTTAIYKLMKNLSFSAAYNSESEKMFAVGEMSYPLATIGNTTIYGLAQCIRDLSANNCSACLANYTATLLSNACSQGGTYTGGVIYGETCFLWYDNKSFNYAALSPPPMPNSANSSPSPTAQGALSPPPMPNSANPSPSPIAQGGKIKNSTIIIVWSATSSAAIVIIVISIWLWTKFMKGKGSHYSETPMLFSYEQLQAATDNFSYLNFLGKGGFGEVFKGTINRKLVAVKRFSNIGNELKLEKENMLNLVKELNLLVNIRHQNIVKLVGCCFGGKDETRCTVYEYMAKGSLLDYWKNSNKRKSLNWTMRFNIIRGSAQGLSYLHNNSVKKTVHIDIKLSNILLDEDLTAKIADFDLTFDIDETHQTMERTCGTVGYIPPEGNKGTYPKRVSDKFDVYSFGVVMLEIVTGERIHNFENSKTVYLLNHIWEHWSSKMAESLIDKDVEMPTKNEVEEMLRCIHIGLLCTQENAQDRPNMLQVVL